MGPRAARTGGRHYGSETVSVTSCLHHFLSASLPVLLKGSLHGDVVTDDLSSAGLSHLGPTGRYGSSNETDTR